MNPTFTRPPDDTSRKYMTTVFRFLAVAMMLATLPLSSFAQAPAARFITQVAFTMPTELETVLEDFHLGAQALVGQQMGSAKAKTFAQRVAAHLRDKGYPFANVRATVSTTTPGTLIVSVKPGKLGVGNVDGNAWLSEEGILESLDWEEGEVFHYGKFHAAASALNTHRFFNVDSKLRPRRGDDGEIIVDADFTVDDELPLIFTANIANDGARQSSGWRAGIGLEWWEPFAQGDRLALSWQTNPSDPSEVSAYSFQYFGESFETVDWILFGGYSESETDDVVSSPELDIFGEGVHFGLVGTRMLLESSAETLALSFGFTYLNVSNSINFAGQSFSDESLSLFLPRLGFQGTLRTGSSFPGKTFWSAALLSDAGLSDDGELATQRPGVSSGFLAGQLGLTTLQPLPFVEGMGLYVNLSSQVANDPLPTSIQKTIGGARTVRGYYEREAFGDNGFHLNAELRLPPFKSNVSVLKGSFQPLFFYDHGYVSSENSMAISGDSVGMQSFGTGMIGTFKHGFNIGLHVGVPIETTPQTDERTARAHLDLNYRF